MSSKCVCVNDFEQVKSGRGEKCVQEHLYLDWREFGWEWDGNWERRSGVEMGESGGVGVWCSGCLCLWLQLFLLRIGLNDGGCWNRKWSSVARLNDIDWSVRSRGKSLNAWCQSVYWWPKWWIRAGRWIRWTKMPQLTWVEPILIVFCVKDKNFPVWMEHQVL